jgi:predicted enzyme related to lactoylglutathione lyase
VDGDVAVGGFVWNELLSTEPDKALAYYRDTLGLRPTSTPIPGGTYHILHTGEVPRAGLMKSPVPGMPSFWVPYVRVAEIDATVAKTRTLGGTVHADVMSMPGVGRFTMISDVTGATLGLLEPEPR